MQRYLESLIKKDLEKKIVILTGPRQCGKTTLAQMLSKNFDYLNMDYSEHYNTLKEKSWDRSKELIIFDELHKLKNWKSWIKGIFDVEGNKPALLVTGSAHLETFRKLNDSLAGRFFHYRLHPIDIKEAKTILPPAESLQRLKNCSGFPEPFLLDDPAFYLRWRKTHTDSIIRSDLQEIQAVKNIKSIEILVQLLRKRVGSPVSYSNLANDLETDPKTVKQWLLLLESLYLLFPVYPFHSNIARSILKEPKYYFYDSASVEADEGAKLENIVACALKKEIHFLSDSLGKQTGLYYLRTKDKKEIDFAVSINDVMTHIIEVKTSDDSVHNGFKTFAPYFPHAKKIQLVEKLSGEKTYPNGLEIRNLAFWLGDLDFSNG